MIQIRTDKKIDDSFQRESFFFTVERARTAFGFCLQVSAGQATVLQHPFCPYQHFRWQPRSIVLQWQYTLISILHVSLVMNWRRRWTWKLFTHASGPLWSSKDDPQRGCWPYRTCNGPSSRLQSKCPPRPAIELPKRRYLRGPSC